MHPLQISQERSLDFDKWHILGCRIYFCWISGLISIEQHMQSRLDPHPTSFSSCCTIRKHIFSPIVASEGSMLYICKYKPQVLLNNYQLEILLMSSWSSWSHSSGKNLWVNHLWVPLEPAASDQPLNTGADLVLWIFPFTSPAWPESVSWVSTNPLVS